MKLVEYLAPMKSASQQKRILAVMYFLQHTTGQRSFTTTEIKDALREARTPGLKSWNLAARLSSAGHAVHAEGPVTARTWELTGSGREQVATFAPALPTDNSTKV